jgi:hypothetical protein
MLSTAPPGVAATPNSTVNSGAKGGGGGGAPSVVPPRLLLLVLCHKNDDEVSSGAACTCSHTSDMATTLLEEIDEANRCTSYGTSKSVRRQMFLHKTQQNTNHSTPKHKHTHALPHHTHSERVSQPTVSVPSLKQSSLDPISTHTDVAPCGAGITASGLGPPYFDVQYLCDASHVRGTVQNVLVMSLAMCNNEHKIATATLTPPPPPTHTHTHNVRRRNDIHDRGWACDTRQI